MDIASIFKRQVFFHSVPESDIFRIEPSPEILIVVDDRTVRVYIKTFIHLNYEREPGNKYSDYRVDALLAYEKKY